MKSVKKLFLTFFVIMLFTFDSKCYAIDYSKTYESDKNYQFSEMDTNSEIVNNLYFNDNITIPSSFSLTDKINIPVADQQNLGLCDLFSTLKSAETNYALKKGIYVDLSERYLDYMTSKYFYGYREPGVLGESRGDGSGYDEVATFMETIGATTEDKVPYRNFTLEEIRKMADIEPSMMITSFVEFPYFGNMKNAEEKEYWTTVLKKHIMKYGSLRAAIYAPNDSINKLSNYNKLTSSLYNVRGVTSAGGGHAISIVGWDDNYSKDNFIVKPQNDGAFLCLNSWGTDWGNGGYFWISYEDEYINQYVGVLNTKDFIKTNEYTNAGKIFHHQGRTAPNKFFGFKFNKTSEDEYLSHITLSAMSFHDGDAKIHYFLNPIDDSFDEDKMILLQTSDASNHLNLGVVLNNPIKIIGDSYSIVVQFEGSNNIMIMNNVDNDGNILPNVNYISDGFGKEWTKSDYNIPIFAYTVNKSISSVSLKSAPTKTTYIKGEELSLDGMKATVKYDDGEIEEIIFDTQTSNVSGFDSNKLGNQVVTVDYKGYKLNFNATVKNDVKSIEIKDLPTKIKYAKGETLDLTGCVITVSYQDGSKENINMKSDAFSISDFDMSKIGEQEITVNYNNLSTKFKINVSNELKSISIKENPTKIVYNKGETLDLTGGYITAYYDDNSEATISMTSIDVTYSNYNSNKIGSQTVLIHYKGKQTSLTINTNNVKNDIVSISVKKEPDKIKYAIGENVDITGGVITVKYQDGTTTDIEMTSSNVIIDNLYSSKPGSQEITVRYNNLTTNFYVIIGSSKDKKSVEEDSDLLVYLVICAALAGIILLGISYTVPSKKKTKNR